jgi:hypothetical protein
VHAAVNRLNNTFYRELAKMETFNPILVPGGDAALLGSGLVSASDTGVCPSGAAAPCLLNLLSCQAVSVSIPLCS